MKTLLQILTDVNSHIDLDASLPTGTELTTRVNYVNQAIWDANSIGQLKEFETTYSASATSSSIPMPANFKDFTSAPQLLLSSGSWESYPLIAPSDIYNYDSSEKYSYITGNPSSRYTLVLNNYTANATLSFSYQRFPSGMATYTDICELSDPEYVVLQTSAYVLQGRDDARFPILTAQAQQRLANMIGWDNKKQRGSVNHTRRIGAGSYSIGS